MKLRTKSAKFDSVKLAQAALWDSADRFRQVADHVRGILCLLNLAIGEVLYPNDAFKVVFGRPSNLVYENHQRVVRSRQSFGNSSRMANSSSKPKTTEQVSSRRKTGRRHPASA